ncbi:hypothetical protein ACQY0O_004071 [Thecaphora frezii]
MDTSTTASSHRLPQLSHATSLYGSQREASACQTPETTPAEQLRAYPGCQSEVEKAESLQYWVQLFKSRGVAAQLSDLTSCTAAECAGSVSSTYVCASQLVRLDGSQLQGLCARCSVGPAAIVKAAFAVVLSQYVGGNCDDEGNIGAGPHVVVGEVPSKTIRYDDSAAEGFAPGMRAFSLKGGVETERQTVESLFRASDVTGPSRRRCGLWDELSVMLEAFFDEGQAARLNARTLRLELSIQSDRIGQRMLATMLAQLCRLLQDSVLRPDRPLRSLLCGISDPALVSVSTTARQPDAACGYYGGDDPLYWFGQYVLAHPEWPAVVVAESDDDDIADASIRWWSYARLDKAANQIAHLFASLELAAGPIGLCMGHSPISVAVLVAIFKSGRVYLPIDDQLPAERKRLLIADSGCALVATEGDRLGDPALFDCPVLDLSDAGVQEGLLHQSGDAAVAAGVGGNDGAYLLYTSGSTGAPKGVRVSRRNLGSFVESYAEVLARECPATLALGGTGRYLGLASRAFDVHLSQTFMAWRFGMAVATGRRMLLLADLKATVRRLAITHLSCVPSLLDQCGLVADEVPSLALVGVGGERLTEQVRDALAARLPVLNAYGPTETTIMCTVGRVLPTSHVRDIGLVLPGNAAFILAFDDRDELVPVLRGCPGELCISGDLVALGYHARDCEVDSGFVTTKDGIRLYRTGDAARMMDDGRIHFLGRRDEQVKMRGQRLELGEVSQRALGCTGGAAVAVTVICKHPGLAKPLLLTLIAPRSLAGVHTHDKHLERPELLTPSSTVARLAERVQSHCRQHLPAYMVPDFVVPVSHLTLLPGSAKIDVRRIKAWLAAIPLPRLMAVAAGERCGSAGPSMQASPPRPSTSAEDTVWSIIQAARPSQLPIDADISIFQLGFDSLGAIRLARALHDAGFPISVSRLVAHPRICDIAAACGAKEPATDLSRGKDAVASFRHRYTASVQSVVGDRLHSILPTLPIQAGTVAQSLGTAGDLVYVATFRVWLRCLDGMRSEDAAATIRTAWTQLAQDQGILRTCFRHVDDQTIAQVVLRDIDAGIHFLRPEDSQVFDERTIFREMLDRINFVPAWRVAIGRNGGFTLYLHHALYDAHSLSLMLDDLSVLCQGSSSKPDVQAPTVEDLVECIASVEEGKAEAFWRRSFGGVHVGISPWRGRERLKAPTMATASVRLGRLEAAAAGMRATVASLAAVTVTLALSRAIGRNDLLVGLVHWGRTVDLEGADRIVGPAVSTLPMPWQRCLLDAQRGGRLSDLVFACHRWSAASLPFQHTSMRSIRKWIDKERTSLVDFLFSFIRPHQGAGKHRGWELQEAKGDTDAAFAVQLVADESKDELRITAKLRQTIACHSLEGLVADLLSLLEKAVVDPDMGLEAIGVANDANKNLKAAGGRDPAPHTGAGRAISDAELRFCRIAAQVAGIDEVSLVGSDTPLIRLGIDSIVALRFASRLNKELGLHVTPHDIVSAASIGSLCDLTLRRGDGPASARASVPSPADDYVCTPLQAGMLNGTLSSASRNLYVYHHAFVLNGAIDLDRLETAFGDLVEAHEILRTGFHLEISNRPGSEPCWCARVQSAKAFSAQRNKLLDRRSSAATAAMTLQQLAREVTFASAQDFRSSPWRASAIACSEGRQLFVVSMHHSLYDGISLRKMFGDLRLAYGGGRLSTRPPFSLAAACISAVHAASVDFWKHNLDGFLRPCLLALPVPTPGTTYRRASVTLQMPLSEVRERCQDARVSLQAFAIVAWAKVLAHASGQRDVCFGLVVSGRYLDLPGVEDVSGPLINTVPMRVRLTDDFESNVAIAEKVQRVLLVSHPHQHASLSTIQSEWRRSLKDCCFQVLFDTLFVFHGVEIDETHVGSAAPAKRELWRSLPHDLARENEGQGSEYPVNISIVQDAGGVQIKGGASDSIGGPGWLPSMLVLLEQTLADLLRRPNLPSCAFPDGLVSLPTFKAENRRLRSPSSQPGTRPLTQREMSIVVRHMTKRLGVDEATLMSCSDLFRFSLDSIFAICIAADSRGDGVPVSAHDILSAGSLVNLVVADRASRDASLAEAATYERLYDEDERQEALRILHLSEAEVEAILPVLPGQRYHINLWLAKQRRFYEPTFTFSATTKLDGKILEVAWTELRRRQQTLRTVFARTSSGRLLQVILNRDSNAWRDTPRSRLAVIDGGPSLEAAALQRVAEVNASPSDLFSPPVRLSLIRGADQDLVMLTMHHACYDDWSLRLVVWELSQLYRALLRPVGAAADTLPPPIDFAAFVEQTFLDVSKNRHVADAFWRESLCSAEATIICGVRCDSIRQTNHLRRSAVTSAQVVEQKCRSHGFGLQVVVILAYARSLSTRSGGQAFPIFGFYNVGRSSDFAGITEMVGPTIAVQPMMVAVGRGSDLVERLATIQEDLVARTRYEQSSVESTVDFDTYLNLLWHRGGSDSSNLAAPSELGDDALLRPFKLPRDSGYFTRQPAMPGRTSVDFQRPHVHGGAALHMDVSYDREAGELSLCARCDRSAMDDGQLAKFCDGFVDEVKMIAAAL